VTNSALGFIRIFVRYGARGFLHPDLIQEIGECITVNDMCCRRLGVPSLPFIHPSLMCGAVTVRIAYIAASTAVELVVLLLQPRWVGIPTLTRLPTSSTPKPHLKNRGLDLPDQQHQAASSVLSPTPVVSWLQFRTVYCWGCFMSVYGRVVRQCGVPSRPSILIPSD